LKSRKAATAPASAAAITATVRSPRVTPMMARPMSTSVVHDAASPSTPSVRLTALLVATTAIAATTARPQPRLGAPSPGKNWFVKPGDGQPHPDEHTGDALEPELLVHGEAEPGDVVDVDDVVEPTGDRTGEQREDCNESLARAIDGEPGDEDHEAEQHAPERWRALLGAVARRAVGGDMLTCAKFATRRPMNTG